MRFESFYSSSKSNFYVVTAANGQRLLIECGCRWKEILKALNYKLDNIAGCLLSHSHADHSKAIEDVLNAGIEVYSSYETFKILGVENHHNTNYAGHKDRFYVGSFEIFSFALEHDVSILGFVIQADNESLLFITDTFMVKQKFGLAFNIIAICCNYDGSWLQQRVEEEKINETYAKRLITSHMEKEVTKSYLRDCCCLDKCTEIHLLHCSGTNIDKEQIRAEIEKEFMITTIIAGGNNGTMAG